MAAIYYRLTDEESQAFMKKVKFEEEGAADCDESIGAVSAE